jgi:hypothetical protein
MTALGLSSLGPCSGALGQGEVCVCVGWVGEGTGAGRGLRGVWGWGSVTLLDTDPEMTGAAVLLPVHQFSLSCTAAPLSLAMPLLVTLHRKHHCVAAGFQGSLGQQAAGHGEVGSSARWQLKPAPGRTHGMVQSQRGCLRKSKQHVWPQAGLAAALGCSCTATQTGRCCWCALQQLALLQGNGL